MIKETIADAGIKATLKLVKANPEKNMTRLINLITTLGSKTFPNQMAVIDKYMKPEDSNIRQLVLNALDYVDADVLEKLITNFYFNVNLIGWPKQKEMRAKYNCNIPWAILLDPTSACNLHCVGCWAADYGNRLNLSYDDIDDIIRQGKELGTYMYIFTGGEPLVRKDDILKLCEKHNDCIFLCFTNGTLIDDEFCEGLLRVKNFIPAISLEGDGEATDSRRGEGVYDKVISAMARMKAHGLPFGISACYTSANYESISSPEFIDEIVDYGALFIWYFHYMPVGSDANEQLLPTPDQRVGMYHRIREYRVTKPIFPMDFQNDGQYVQGCIAGGRRYLHINAEGDMDPCVFIHFSDTNIHEHTLLEGLQAPLFMAYHDGQPFNDNMLQPCPMLENPQKLRDIIEKTGAPSSNLEANESVEALCSRCDEYAKAWAPVAAKLWQENPHVGHFSH